MIRFLSILSFTTLLDFATKSLVRKLMNLGTEIPLLPFFSLVHVENTGVAFGMFQNQNLFFLILGLAVVAVLFVVGLKSAPQDRLLSSVLPLIIGGALGNLIDRLFFGRVTDFLDFFIGLHHWPAFNVADSAICVGAGLLLWNSVRCQKKS